MTDAELEKGLTELGRATVPMTPLRSHVMARIAALPIPGSDSDRIALSSSRRMFRVAAVVLATAACIGVTLFVRRSRPEPPPRPQIVLSPQTQPALLPATETFPRLADLRRAYAQSPEAFERLLQQPTSGASHAAEHQLSVGDAVHLDSKLYQ